MRKKHAATSTRNASTKFSARYKRRSSTWTDPYSGVTSGETVSKHLRGRKINPASCDSGKTTDKKSPLKQNVIIQKLITGNHSNRDNKSYHHHHHLHKDKRTSRSSYHNQNAKVSDSNIISVHSDEKDVKSNSDSCVLKDNLPILNSVYVFDTVAEALSVIKSGSSKTPLVFLTKINQTVARFSKSESLVLDDYISRQSLCAESINMDGNKTKTESRKELTNMKNKSVTSSAAKVNISTNSQSKNRDLSLSDIRSMIDTNKATGSPIATRKTPINTKTPRGNKTPLPSPDSKKKDEGKRKYQKSKSVKTPDIVVTPPKQEKQATPKNSQIKKSSTSLRGRKSTSPKTPGTGERELRKREASISPKATRGQSRTMSPGRKKRSPDDVTKPLHLDIPDPETGSQVKRTRSPSARFKEDMILYPWDSTRKSPKKSPAGKTSMKSEQETVEKPKPKTKSSPNTTNSQGSPKKPISPKKKESLSPKQDKPAKEEIIEDSVEPTAGTSSVSLEKVTRTLSFGADVTPVEGINSLITKDYKYKYQSVSVSSNPIGLTDLISKVSSSIESTDENLTSLFGQAEEIEDSEESEPSVDNSLNSTDESADSDKTIINHNDSAEPEVEDQIKTDETSEISTSFTTEKDADITDGKQSNGSKDEKICDISDTAVCENTDKLSECDINEKDTAEIKNQSESIKLSDPDASDTFCEENIELDMKATVDKVSEKEELECNNKEQSSDESIERKEAESEHVKTSIFDMFGLKLKRKPTRDSQLDSNNKSDLSSTIISSRNSTPEKSKTELDKKHGDSANVTSKQESDEDVMIVSESYPDKSDVIVLSDEENQMETDKSNAKKPKFFSVDKSVEPKPLDILSHLEQEVKDKKSVFLSAELDTYLYHNKENIGPPSEDGKCKKVDSDTAKRMLENPYPDFDDIDNMVFLSFPCEQALQAHIKLEKNVEWLHDSSLKKMTQLKSMKERQQDSGSKRLKDIKFAHEQKQSFRGVPMKMIKYNKMLTQELQAILKGSNEVTKAPEKTADITKIKGWKNKYKGNEDLLEATNQQLSESGKIHWRTEEKLLKNLDPNEVKEIGLDLKKKRRKLINFSKRKSGKFDGGGGSLKGDSEEEFEEFELEEGAITEKDVYNEDDDKPQPDKIPYKDKYLSQHKYGQRKLFVRKMGLDSVDEKILKKLGTSKITFKDDPEEVKEQPKQKQTKAWFTVSKITQSMAIAAASALNKQLITKQRTLMKKDKKGKRGGKTISRASSPRTTEVEKNEEVEVEEREEYGEDDSGEDDEEVHMETEDTNDPDFIEYTGKTRNQSKGLHKGEPVDDHHDTRNKEKKKNSAKENCDQPGCRYGCICHLCKLSDSSEEKETDRKPPCDKEYCKLGCICESIDNKLENQPHCRKPSCMFECKCPPKQPKPDIPKSRDGKKRKKKWAKKKGDKKSKSPEDKPEDDDPNDWEPPSKKKKRGTYNLRFANLPKRESTYRVAKNLDAVSRKAMEVYATSEMYAEQKIRRRKSDPVYDMGDGDIGHITDVLQSSHGEHSKTHTAQKNESSPIVVSESPSKNSVYEVSDDSEGESFPADMESCSRIQPYSGNRRRHIRRDQDQSGSGSITSAPVVIDLIESEEEDSLSRSTQGGRRSHPRKLRSSDGGRTPEGRATPGAFPRTLTERMGLIGKHGQDNETWKTQMVCLKAKKKSEEKSVGEQSEIKLLEIISNCNWEMDRKNMLSKISHVITKDMGGMPNEIIMWQRYVLHFLPRADKPAVIPPELKSTLPNSMYSIRVRVTRYVSDAEKQEPEQATEQVEDKPTAAIAGPSQAIAGPSQEPQEGERRDGSMKVQKKLIDKIKFAEKLRDLIIAEEQRGSDPSKFSVSLDGIEKALKKYKTQLWKAYTGSNNMTLNQLKKAVEIAKAKAGKTDAPSTSSTAENNSGGPDNTSGKRGMSFGDLKKFVVGQQETNEQQAESSEHSSYGSSYQQNMNATLARISMNQGLKIVHTVPQHNTGGFIPLANFSNDTPQRTAMNAMPSQLANNMMRAGCPLVACGTTRPLLLSKSILPATVTSPHELGEPLPSPECSKSDTLVPSSNKTNTTVNASEPDTVTSVISTAMPSTSTALSAIPVSEINIVTASSRSVRKPSVSQISSLVTANGTGCMSTAVTSQGPANLVLETDPTLQTAVVTTAVCRVGSCSKSSKTEVLPLVPTKPSQSDVLLIPVQENGANKWDPNAHPVLSAKMTLLPTGKPSPIQNGSPIVNTVLTPQVAPGIIPVIPLSGPPSVKPSGMDKNSTVPSFDGKSLVLQSNQPGKLPIMINSIQPVSSSSPVYTSVQKLSRPVKYNSNTSMAQPITLAPTPPRAALPVKPGVYATSSDSGVISPLVSQVMTVTGSSVMLSMAGSNLLHTTGVNSTSVPTSMCSVYPVKRAPLPVTFSTVPITQAGKPISSVPVKCIKSANNIVTIVPLIPGEPIPSGYSTLKPSLPQTGNTLTPASKVKPSLCVSNSLSNSNKTIKCAQNDNVTHSPALANKISSNKIKYKGDLNSIAQSPNLEVNKKLKLSKLLHSDTSEITNAAIDKEEIKSDCDTKKSDIVTQNIFTDDFTTLQQQSATHKTVLMEETVEPENCRMIDKPITQNVSLSLVQESGSMDEAPMSGAKKRKKPADDEQGDHSVKAKVLCVDDNGSEFESVLDDALSKESKVAKSSKSKKCKDNMDPESDEQEFVDIEILPEKEREGMRLLRERCRRLRIKHLFDKLSELFKDVPEMQGFTNGIPIQLVLNTAFNHIGDLKQTDQILTESLEDGTQRKQSLETELKKHIDSFARSGIPEKVIKNFLKSVAFSQPSMTTASAKNESSSSSSSQIDTGRSANIVELVRTSTSDVSNVNAQNVNSYGNAAKALEKIVGEKVYTLSDLSPTELQKLSASGGLDRFVGASAPISPDVHPSTSKEYALGASNCENESLVTMDTQRLVAMDTQGDDIADSDGDEIRSTTGYDSMLDQDLDSMVSLSDECQSDDT